MKNFDSLPEFRRELRRLSRKYGTLDDDLEIFREVLSASPTGLGNGFTAIHSTEVVKIVKARMACRFFRGKSLRVIYAYLEREERVEFVEIYYKGNRENENRNRIKEYLKSIAEPD